MPPIASPADDHPARVLTDDVALGALGLVEVKLTPEEERVLSRPVDETRIRIKPTGQPYLSHPEYTKWFNDAFGRLGWSIVPATKPKRDGEHTVLVAYVLYIHGQPAAFAWGEHEYFENNREQTYGDVVEATTASALRRCAKRFGVGLEMWDKQWLEAWIAGHAIRVPVKRNRKQRDGSWKEVTVYQWRRKDDVPLDGELSSSARVDEGGVEQTQRRTAPPAGHNTKQDEPINQAQAQRMWIIARNSGRSEEVVRTWLQVRFKVASSKEILRRDYDFICRSIEAPGSLPLSV